MWIMENCQVTSCYCSFIIVIAASCAFRLQIFPSDRTSCDIITLKVKSEDGSQTYMLKMFFSETMGHLRKYLDHHRSEPIHYLFSSCSNRRTFDIDITLTTEAMTILVMTSSAHSQGAAMKTRQGRYNPTAWPPMLHWCWGRLNTLIQYLLLNKL